MLVVAGVTAIFAGMVTGGRTLFCGVLLPVGLFVELAAVSLRRRRRHNFYK